MRSDGKVFRLRPRVLELGYAYLSSLTLPEVATPHLEQLAADAHESTSVSVLDGVDIVYVARVATKRIMTVAIALGTRFPAYATSMGRVLLAAQDDEWLAGYLASTPLRALTPHTVTDPDALRDALAGVRERGWALVDQELEEGLRSIAVPLRDPAGEVVAAVNISASAGRGTPESVRTELLPRLLRTAASIEDDLRGGRPGRSRTRAGDRLRRERPVSPVPDRPACRPGAAPPRTAAAAAAARGRGRRRRTGCSPRCPRGCG